MRSCGVSSVICVTVMCFFGSTKKLSMPRKSVKHVRASPLPILKHIFSYPPPPHTHTSLLPSHYDHGLQARVICSTIQSVNLLFVNDAIIDGSGVIIVVCVVLRLTIRLNKLFFSFFTAK